MASGSVQRGAAVKDVSICEGIFFVRKGGVVVPFFAVPFNWMCFSPNNFSYKGFLLQEKRDQGSYMYLSMLAWGLCWFVFVVFCVDTLDEF